MTYIKSLKSEPSLNLVEALAEEITITEFICY